MRKAAVVGLAGCAGSAAGFCVVCWLESRHRQLGRLGTVHLWQLLLIRLGRSALTRGGTDYLPRSLAISAGL